MSRVKNLKRRVKSSLKKWRLRYIRKRYGFDGDAFAKALRHIGIERGQVVLVHISWDAFEAFDGKPTDVLRMLQEAVGEEGTLMMPTMPFPGSALDWVKKNPVVELKRAPSRMGLPTELFRRLPGVVRSVHPTHPVAAWGRLAEEITKDHNACPTPCGRQSPFGRLLDHDGRILFLGPTIESMTFFHTAEEIFAQDLPCDPFTKEEYEVTTVAPDGTRYETRMRLFDREASQRRTIEPLGPALRDANAWRESKVGTLGIIHVKAQDALDAFESCIRSKVSLYE